VPSHLRPLPGALLLTGLLAGAILTGGCGTPIQAAPDFKAYDLERFSRSAPFSRELAASPAAACQAARQALLSQGYALFVEEAARIHGRKFFRPTAGVGVEIAVTVTCLASHGGEARSMVYVTAWQDGFMTRRSPVAASVGLPVMGSVSMPVGTTEDSLVKVGVETVQDKDYYARFFALLQELLRP
jgi:hypothetical protein